MAEQQRRQDHPTRMNEPTGEPVPAICGMRHPLLKDLRCERLRGHPGKHGGVADTEVAELALEWGDEVIDTPR
jgi:hypothetical protein